MAKRSWKGRVAAAAGLLAGALAAGPAVAQTTALSETWEGGTVGVINPAGGTINLGDNFTGDNTWTVVTPTQSPGSGAHMSVAIVDFNGSQWIHWQADELDDDPDVQDYYQAPVSTPFDLDEVQSFTFSFDFIPTVVATGGRRSATFHVGEDIDNSYRFQINVRDAASELIEVASIVGGVSTADVYGDPSNFGVGAIEADGEYNFSITLVPGATETSYTCAVRDSSNNIIESGSGSFSAAEMLPLSTTVDYFVLRARNRTFQMWDNLLLEFTVPAEPGEQPEITPNASFYQVGDTVVLSAPAGGTNYEWFRNGVLITDGGTVSGATTQNLTINPADQGDTGEITVTFNDGVEDVESLPYNLLIFPLGALPVMGWIGIVTLAMALAMGTVVYVNRRRRIS